MKLRLSVLLSLLPVLFHPTAKAQPLELSGSSLPAELLNWLPELENQSLSLVPPPALPKAGTFWHLPAPGERMQPPYPCPPEELDMPVYSMGGFQFLVGNATAAGLEKVRRQVSQPPPPGGGGNGTNRPPAPQIDTRRNSVKFAHQVFWLVNTNDAASSFPDLYAVCCSFPASPAGPNLQVTTYGTNAVVIRANHFNYSSDTRDFALLVTDRPDGHVWKNVDLLGSSDSQDGWLIQGMVNRRQVVDPMYLLVTNFGTYAAFFRAIPYAGPQIALIGPAANSTVSGAITLQAPVSDLSGTSNELTAVNVNGLDARYTLSAGNTITLDSRYSINGPDTVSVKIDNYNATAVDPSIQPTDVPNTFESTTNLPLNFQNSTYVFFQSDNASPDILTNFIQFGVAAPTYISAQITEPSSGRILASFSGTDPSSPVVQLNWTFTEANGAPYTNDTYVVSFNSSNNPAPQVGGAGSLILTNSISRAGVRPANWVINNYEEIGRWEPGGSNRQFINSEMARWFGAMENMYENLYSADFTSQSQYFSWQIGSGRDNPQNLFPFDLNPNTELGWRPFIQSVVTNLQYSDFNWQGHGNAWLIGGGPFPSWGGGALRNNVNTTISSADIKGWMIANGKTAPGKRYRMRKVGLWSCYSARSNAASAPGSWYNGFGINVNQTSGFMWKNAGIFFNDVLDFSPYGSNPATDIEEVLSTCDKYFVMGANPFPGGANPNYSIGFAVNVTIGVFPELTNAVPVIIGYPLLPYAGVYDDELRNLDNHQVIQ